MQQRQHSPQPLLPFWRAATKPAYPRVMATPSPLPLDPSMTVANPLPSFPVQAGHVNAAEAFQETATKLFVELYSLRRLMVDSADPDD
jgi:hypothetical protein